MIERQVVLALTLTAIFAARAQATEGFGLLTKTAVDMTRTTAPGINISGTGIEVTGTSDRSVDADAAKVLRRYTEESILAGDKRLSASANPDVTVRLLLGPSYADSSWAQETDIEYQKTGTKEEWNEKKQKYETKDVYENVEVTKNIETVQGTVQGTYRITDRSGRDLDSGSFHQTFSNDSQDGTGAPAKDEVEDALLHTAAGVVAARLVPTHDRVNVIVPRGSFEALIPLAEKGDWNAYLAGVEAVKENKKPDQEAYRQYALGVAKEALAYVTEDVARATELLRQSVDHYKKAIADNPGEKIFSEDHKSLLFTSVPAPVPRAEKSLAAYQTWASRPAQVAAVAEAPASKSTKTGTMRNKTVIQMAKAGLSDAMIESAIDSGVATRFNVTPEGLDNLTKGGVSPAVIAYMQRKTKK
ncbi:MAG: hypothetical protein ACXV5L_10750 [Thermoanaerobaculia bacterium]